MNQYLYSSSSGKWNILYHSPSKLAYELFSYIDNVGIYECSPQYSIERKDYFSYLILATRSGKGMCEIKDKTYTLDKNHILFINCYEWHKYYTAKDSTNWEFAWVHFDGQLVAKYFQHINETAGPVILVDKPQLFLDKIDRILELKQIDSSNFELHVSTILTHMLNVLLINAKKEDNHSLNVRQAEITQAVNYIKSNYMLDLNIEDIARTVNLSKSHFSRLFRQNMGYSPYEYLIKYRLTISKYELCHTDKPISQIAKDVGFANTNNYISTFKRYEKVTPNHYRKNNMQLAMNDK